MLWRKFQGLFDRVFPGLVRQLGYAKDQVNADVPDSAFAKDMESLDGIPCIVAAVHPTENVIVE